MSMLEARHGFESCIAPLLTGLGLNPDEDLEGNSCRLLIDERIPIRLCVEDTGVLTMSVLWVPTLRALDPIDFAALLVNNRHGDQYPELIVAVGEDGKTLMLHAKQKYARMDSGDVLNLFHRLIDRAFDIAAMLESRC